MEIRNLITFVRVAELRSFSRAAEVLGYSQSAVSVQIRQLETELGAPLFDRINKTVQPTQQGQAFLVYANQVLRTLDEARTALHAAPTQSGTLRIGMAESLCLSRFPQILALYHRRYPQVELSVTGITTDTMERMLDRNELDLVYTVDRQTFPSDLVKVLDVPEPICFIAPADHPLARRESLVVEDLLGEAFILTEKGMSYRDQLDQLLASRGMALTPFLELGNTDLIRALVEDGLGLSFLPEYAVEQSRKAGRVVRLPVADCAIETWRQVFYHKDKWVTPQMRAMFDLLGELEAD